MGRPGGRTELPPSVSRTVTRSSLVLDRPEGRLCAVPLTPANVCRREATMEANVLVIGAGPAGLAVAACLKRRGVEPLVVDRGNGVGDSWAARYDRLHLHTPRVQSALPGLRMPKRFGRWVS